jgi:glyoxylase-like metal-dependent hydrolase (beta-lactamase superfamily II)
MAAFEITARELWERLHGRRGRRFYLLDVRDEDEAARWRPEGTLSARTVNVPCSAFVDDAGAALARVPRDAGEAVAICAKGDSSELVRDVLREARLAAVHLAGGMQAWGDLHVPLRVRPPPHDDGRVEVWQVSRYGKGCLSYAIVVAGEAAIVDPSRFVDVYVRLARSRGASVVEVIDTHVHADHLSGGPELARRTGARHRVAADVPGAAPLDEAIELGGGAAALLPLRTPGHTPDSTCLLLGRHLFSGDTLFAAGVGRPDLGGHVDEWGRALHRSLREVVGRLPDDVLVLPAHFASPAEASADGIVCARLGELRARAPELSIDDPAALVALLRAGAAEPPAAYARIVRANLGLEEPGDRASEWELGRSECAARGGRSERWSGPAMYAG